jgi:hypothetical protein
LNLMMQIISMWIGSPKIVWSATSHHLRNENDGGEERERERERERPRDSLSYTVRMDVIGRWRKKIIQSLLLHIYREIYLYKRGYNKTRKNY